MFDFGNANDAQKLAISSSNGAVLITAGPGTGKTEGDLSYSGVRSKA